MYVCLYLFIYVWMNAREMLCVYVCLYLFIYVWTFDVCDICACMYVLSSRLEAYV